MDPVIFGLTGVTAGGKSTVAKIMRNIGFPIVDIDNMLHNIFNPGTNAHRELLNLLGPDYLKVDGSIDNTKLSLVICKEQWISNIVEDIIEDEVDQILSRIIKSLHSSQVKIAGIESSRILESRVNVRLKKIVLVTANDNIRIKRLVTRSKIPLSLADKIISHESKIENQADFIIYNNGTFEDLKQTVEETSKNLISSLECDI